MPSGRRRGGSGGGGGRRGSLVGRGGGGGRGGGSGTGLGDYSQQRQAAEAMRDIASRLGFECTINYGPEIQWSPQMKFLMACDDGNLRRVKALVDIMDEDDRESLASVRMEGLGALHSAAMNGKLDICIYLVEKLKFDVNSPASDDSGVTPLPFAVSDGQVAAVRYLLDKGADPNKQDHEGYAPLHEAAKEGFDEIAQLLLSKGASVDVSSSEGTPLHAAAAYGKSSIMQILLEHHADPNKVSAKLCTPLAETLLSTPERLNESTCLKCMKILVKAGADLNSRNPETPLVIATIKGLKECVGYLLKAGADANIPANDVGSRPIEIAAESGRGKLVEILFPFTSPIHAVSNWSIDGIIAYAKSSNSKDKVNQSDKDSKVQLKLHSEKTVKKQDAGASKPDSEVKASDKDRKAQLKLQGGKSVEGKDYSGALKFYSEAINLDPTDAVLYSNKSFCHLKMGEARHALHDAIACIRLRPEWTKGYYRKGAALMSLKEYKQACDAFMAGVKLDPTNEDMQQAF
ncbi:uncharacterized protein LOC133915718 isoform X3 [Phragmites australis]|nr:uncharacterized protein LOC133915718 isoform X3 [Phragmites australis]